MRPTSMLLCMLAFVVGCDAARRSLVGWFDATYEPPTTEDPTAGQTAISLKPVAGGFTQVTDLQFVPTKQKRLVVLEKGGAAKVVELLDDGHRMVGELLRVDVQTESELGLLGLAFHPRFADNGLFYVNYNPKAGTLRTRIAEWSVAPHDVGTARAHEKRVLLEVTQPYQNHNAGQLVFGPDGFLYIGLGDGGWMGDPHENGQNPATLLGSMLRIDVDRRDGALAYGIPPDNPFIGRAGYRGEIWAYGFRNPWRYTFDPGGRLIVADVGQDAWEEVDIVPRGANMGWDAREGRHCFEPARGCGSAGLVEPVWEYGRGHGSSVTGGLVYLGRRVPALHGRYLVADFVQGNVWALQLPASPGESAVSEHLGRWPVLISTFGRDSDGEIYAADFGAGTIYRFEPAPSDGESRLPP